MASQTEFFVKMNRLALPDIENQPVPVKFRPVFYDPYLSEEQELSVQDDSDESDAETDNNVNRQNLPHFFKDPLAGPLMKEEDENDSSEVDGNFKLGRNMRASNGRIKRQKDIHELMNARRQLLQEQKEQIEIVSEEESSEQAASILVNNLLLKGFQISAPSDSEPPSQLQLRLKTEMLSEGEQQASAQRQKLIGAFHKELVRVHAKDSSDG